MGIKRIISTNKKISEINNIKITETICDTPKWGANKCCKTGWKPYPWASGELSNAVKWGGNPTPGPEGS